MSNSKKLPKILVIDDDYSFANYAKMILEMNHYRAEICTDGHAAMDFTLQEHPDLILLDMNMKTVTGTEAIKDLKDNPKTQNIPIVLCSITHDRYEVKEAIDAGAAKFLPKPLKTAELIQAVRNILGRVD